MKLPEITQSNIKSLPENVVHNLSYFLKTNEGFAKTPFLKSLLKLQPSVSSLVAAPMAAEDILTNKR